MPIREFPDPRLATEDGIVGLGGDLHPESLVLAYSQGIFPWPIEGLPLAWFCPPERAILRFEDLHLPRSLRRAARSSGLEFTVDRAFDQVIEACATVTRKGERGTWITPEMLEAYRGLHRLGIAHSVEAWKSGALVGGIYGVEVLGCFAGESMFHRVPNASKLALLSLIEHLRARGAEWIDIQVMTPHLEALGARPIPRDEFLSLLARTQRRKLRLF